METWSRWYKKIIYDTNHRNVERALLQRENVQQTVRLILANAFRRTDRELTELFYELYTECPSIFDPVLPLSERLGLEAVLTEDYYTGDDESELRLDSDDTHIHPAALGRIAPGYAGDVMKLPLRSRGMSDSFRRLLRASYHTDYSMPNIFEFGKVAIQWSKKFAFDDRCVNYLLY